MYALLSSEGKEFSFGENGHFLRRERLFCSDKMEIGSVSAACSLLFEPFCVKCVLSKSCVRKKNVNICFVWALFW